MKPNWARLSWHKTDGFNSGLLMTDVLTLDPGHERQWASFLPRVGQNPAQSAAALQLSPAPAPVGWWLVSASASDPDPGQI